MGEHYTLNNNTFNLRTKKKNVHLIVLVHWSIFIFWYKYGF